MARHNIHRLVVTDSAGRITGLLTNTDLLRVQTRCPLYLPGKSKPAKILNNCGQ